MKSSWAEDLATRTESRAPLMAMLHAGFVLTGIINTILGPLLPLLAAEWSLTDAQAGYLFTSLFVGSIAGVVVSSWMVPRVGSRLPLMLGLGMMAVGVGTLGSGTSIFGLVSALLMGIGLGLTVPTTNLLVSELNPQKRAAALNLVNLSWGVGAVASPSLVALAQQMNRTAPLQYGISAVLIVLAGSLRFFAFPPPARAADRNRASGDDGVWSSRFVPILGALFFLYVGSETSVGGWIAAYAHRVMTGPGTTWAMMPSFFWAALLAGRAVAPAVLRHISEEKVARGGLTLAALGISLLLLSRNGREVAASVAIAGLGFSSVYPIVIASLSHKFGAMASRVGGLTFTLAGLGGASLPLLVGHLSTRYTSLRAGLVIQLLG